MRAAPAGVPLGGMALSVTDSNGQVVAAVHTDADGRFALPDLAEGEYTLVAAGYPPQALSVAVHAGEVSAADIRFGEALTEEPPRPGGSAETGDR